ALETLVALEDYITRDSIASLSYMRESIEGDLKIITALRQLIEAGLTPATNTASAESPREEASDAEISPFIEKGDSLFASGDYLGAFEAYTDAVEISLDNIRIPAVIGKIEVSVSALLEELEDDIADVRRERNRALASAEASAREASLTAANPGTASGNTKALETLRTMRKVFGDTTISSSNSDERSREEVYSLLQAKVRMRKIMNSDEIRASYPELYESMQNYYTAYGEEQWEKGSVSAVMKVVEILEILNNPDQYSRQEISETLEGFPLESELFEPFLNTVESLLE
ncbi:MAG: hypothetical protein ACLFRY_15960, partial [Spirochaetia bacterium]